MESESDKKEDMDTECKLECAVCLQNCIQPVQLPCRHVFCYLCVKGVSHQSKRCAMCRQEIPADYLDNPQLVELSQSNMAFEGSYQWFYEGRNGWWQYDDRTSMEIETEYKKGEKQCEVLIAGFLYTIDFDRNLQMRRCDPNRKRRIKRDNVTIAKKGIAGIRLPLDFCDSISPVPSDVTWDPFSSSSDDINCPSDMPTNDQTPSAK